MKKLQLFGDIFEAEIICKTDKAVTGHVGSGIVFHFENVKDFSAFELLDDAEWDAPILNPVESVDLLNKRQEASESAIISLMDMSLMGGI